MLGLLQLKWKRKLSNAQADLALAETRVSAMKAERDRVKAECARKERENQTSLEKCVDLSKQNADSFAPGSERGVESCQACILSASSDFS